MGEKNDSFYLRISNYGLTLLCFTFITYTGFNTGFFQNGIQIIGGTSILKTLINSISSYLLNSYESNETDLMNHIKRVYTILNVTFSTIDTENYKITNDNYKDYCINFINKINICLNLIHNKREQKDYIKNKEINYKSIDWKQEIIFYKFKIFNNLEVYDISSNSHPHSYNEIIEINNKLNKELKELNERFKHIESQFRKQIISLSLEEDF